MEKRTQSFYGLIAHKHKNTSKKPRNQERVLNFVADSIPHTSPAKALRECTQLQTCFNNKRIELLIELHIDQCLFSLSPSHQIVILRQRKTNCKSIYSTCYKCPFCFNFCSTGKKFPWNLYETLLLFCRKILSLVAETHERSLAMIFWYCYNSGY